MDCNEKFLLCKVFGIPYIRFTVALQLGCCECNTRVFISVSNRATAGAKKIKALRGVIDTKDGEIEELKHTLRKHEHCNTNINKRHQYFLGFLRSQITQKEELIAKLKISSKCNKILVRLTSIW